MNNLQVNGNQNQSVNSSSNPQSLSDQTLYQLCRTYGARALEWRRKFTGLLPEVFRRKLYEKKGFDSIFVFAKKLAGLSEEQVRRVLSLEEKFREFPALLAILINGEVSVNKLMRITSIANPENQEFLAVQVRILSKSAVETLVRDEKWGRRDEVVSENLSVGLFENCDGGGELQNANGLIKQESRVKSVPGHGLQAEFDKRILGTQFKISYAQVLNLSPEVHKKLLEIQQKGLDLNELLMEFLKKREVEIAQKKEQISKKVLQKEEKKRASDAKFEEVMDYILATPSIIKGQARPAISATTKKILHEEFGTKCSIKNCQKLAETIHHTQRFALSGSHDPHYLAPLCKEHHEIAHAVDVRCQEVRGRW